MERLAAALHHFTSLSSVERARLWINAAAKELLDMAPHSIHKDVAENPTETSIRIEQVNVGLRSNRISSTSGIPPEADPL